MRRDRPALSGPDDVLERTLNQIARYLRFDVAVLYGYASDLHLLWPLAQDGDLDERIPPVVPGLSFIGTGWNANASVLADEATLAITANKWLQIEGAKTAVALPLHSGGESIGVIIAFSRRVMDVNAEMLRAVSAFASQLASICRRNPTLLSLNILRYQIEAITTSIETASRESIDDEDSMYESLARHARLLTGAQVVGFENGESAHAFFLTRSGVMVRRLVTYASHRPLRVTNPAHTIVRHKGNDPGSRVVLLWRSQFTPTPAMLRMVDLIAHTVLVINTLRQRLTVAHQEQRARYLVNMTKALDASLDFPTVIDQVKDWIVPELADHVVIQHNYLDVDEQMMAQAPGAGSLTFMDRVLRGVSATETALSTGRSVQLQFDGSAARDHLIEVVIEPMVSAERITGTISFGRLSTRGRSSQEERALYSQLTARITTALSNATSFGNERALANILQRAMLATAFPNDERVVFDAAYTPASTNALVGGDWYDVFRLDANRFVVSIGDVGGHGIRASITMNVVRLAFRAAALDGDDPITVLRRGDVMLTLEGEAPMVTALYGVVDVARNVFTYACAGHMPPYRLRNGMVDVLSTSGHPLGLGVDVAAERRAFEASFLPGDTLLLYTDGLVEYGRDLIGGEQHLRELIQNIPSSASRGTLARDLHTAVFANTERTQNDDVAILAISMLPDRVRSQTRTEAPNQTGATLISSALG